MAIIKCKMCGGDIALSEDRTTGKCEYCGSLMTFPRISDEPKLNLFNRANHLRQQNEFDKAILAYEKILDMDDTDAEAHWGAVLARYGIEYVEDPASHERIPTCHRVQPTSILADSDYEAALKYAPDDEARSVYEQQAKTIAEIQKGILAISDREKPYDVFICYKETDENGRRTVDSTLAQDIYYQLTNEGYKVFFSRITLEDKLGREYEPYIFAALNSARVMLVVGTKEAFFNAVWVKNEWSRYLDLMKKDRTRLLIPCYRDMDPYDLPQEMSMLQSQDMSRIGFIQDILHGIKKVIGRDEPVAETPLKSHIQADNLVKRAGIFMEDGNFESATEYLNKALDLDPEFAPAYLAKVQAKRRLRRISQLSEQTEPLERDPDYLRALRYAGPEQLKTYEGYAAAVRDRIDNANNKAQYERGMALMHKAQFETEFAAAAQAFESAHGYGDAAEKARICRERAESIRAKDQELARQRRAQTAQHPQQTYGNPSGGQTKVQIPTEKNNSGCGKRLFIFVLVIFVLAVTYFGVIAPRIENNTTSGSTGSKWYEQINTSGR